MSFILYFIIYGVICTVLSGLYYYGDRHNSGSVFKLIFGFSIGIILVTVTYASIEFISLYQDYWTLARRILKVFLLVVQYFLVVLVHYGILKSLYKDWN